MKLSRILNEADSLDFHVKTTWYPDYDHLAAARFDIPGPIALPGMNYADAGTNLHGIPTKVKDIVILPDLLWINDGLASKQKFENPLDNIIDEFGDDKAFWFEIYGKISKMEGNQSRGPRWSVYQPFRAEFEYEFEREALFAFSGRSWPPEKNMIPEHIINKIVYPVFRKHYVEYMLYGRTQ